MNAEEFFKQAVKAIKLGQKEEARQYLMEVVRLQPRYEQAWLALASVLPDKRQARDCLKRVLALNPDNPVAKDWLAFTEQETARQAAVAEMTAAADIPLSEPDDATRPTPRLGQYLLDYKFISTDQLKAALRAQRQASAAGAARRLGDLLIEQHAITPERLNFALREQQRSFTFEAAPE